MDLTSKYIKQCKKAEEIQREWKPQFGDYVYGVPDTDGNLSVSIVIAVDDSVYERLGMIRVAVIDRWSGKVDCELWEAEKLIWLPTQDQLQEILAPNNFFWNTMAMEMVLQEMRRAYGILLESPYFNSGEQFWLAFVMWKRYGKVWDDEKEEWVEIKEG